VGFDPFRQHRLTPGRAAARRRADRLFLAAGFVAVVVLLIWALLGGD